MLELKGLKHAPTVEVLDIGICGVPIVCVQLASDHLLIQLEVDKGLNLANAFKLVRLVNVIVPEFPHKLIRLPTCIE